MSPLPKLPARSHNTISFSIFIHIHPEYRIVSSPYQIE
jgi:hypothetical protein